MKSFDKYSVNSYKEYMLLSTYPVIHSMIKQSKFISQDEQHFSSRNNSTFSMRKNNFAWDDVDLNKFSIVLIEKQSSSVFLGFFFCFRGFFVFELFLFVCKVFNSNQAFSIKTPKGVLTVKNVQKVFLNIFSSTKPSKILFHLCEK